MVRREHAVPSKSHNPEPSSVPFFIPYTYEHPTDVPYCIETGALLVDEGDMFPGAHLTLLGNVKAILNSISGGHGHFTSCEIASVRTAKFQEVPKPTGWNFCTPLSFATVIPQY